MKTKKNEPTLKVCFRCNHPIPDGSNFYQFIEWNENKIVHIDYCHRTCWDEFIKSMGNIDESMKIIRGLKGTLQGMGMLPADEVSI